MQARLDAVRAAHPASAVARAEFPKDRDQAVLFKLTEKGLTGKRLLAIDPYRGAIVRDGPRADWPLEWIFNVHDNWLIGPVGETLIGVEGLLLLFLAITGPVIWWPGKKRLRQGFGYG